MSTDPILVHTTSHHGTKPPQQSTGNSVLMLTISRGRSRFPNRPVLRERFLIGGSPSCDLRLSAPEMPPLHSLIVHSGRGYRWDTMMSDPVVRHNERVSESFPLNDGDRVSIGEITFDIRLRSLSEITELLGVDSQMIPSNEPVDERRGIDDLDTTSAADLVNRLERDLRWIEQFDQRRKMGADAILHTVNHQIAVSERSDQPVVESRLAERLGHLASELARFAAGLERRAREMAEGHCDFAASSGTVLDVERNLADRLNTLADGLTPPDDRDDGSRSAA